MQSFRLSEFRHLRLNVFAAATSVFFVVIAATCAYLLIAADHHPVFTLSEGPKTSALAATLKPFASAGTTKPSGLAGTTCDLFRGKWVRNERYPLYDASRCPFAERGFNCRANGRKDTDYTKLQWKPEGCDVPQFDPREALEHLRGKRVVFVGDSLSRTQWESFICMLMTGVDDGTSSVYEINGSRITRQIRFLGVNFSSFDLRVDFYRSVFLVQQGRTPSHAPKWTIRLDEMDDISREWIDSDVLVFNSGHWWSPEKLSGVGWYFDKLLKPRMPIPSAFETGLRTWASWVDANINRNRTRVFFRTFESTHWKRKKGGGRSCEVTRHPSPGMGGREKSFVSDAVLNVVGKMKTPVIPLHVTPMGAFRSDAHAGRWSYEPWVPDCTHWCLPGVPEAWNEIMFSFILSKNS